MIRLNLLLPFILILTSKLIAQDINVNRFDKYLSPILRKQRNEKVDLKLFKNSVEYNFRTRIRYSYENDTVSFGGHYIVCIWGCGTNCLNGVMIDVIDGRIYEFPANEAFWMCSNEDISYKEIIEKRFNSNLLIIRNCQNMNSNNKSVNYTETEYLWNDKTKKFKLIATKRNLN